MGGNGGRGRHKKDNFLCGTYFLVVSNYHSAAETSLMAVFHPIIMTILRPNAKNGLAKLLRLISLEDSR